MHPAAGNLLSQCQVHSRSCPDLVYTDCALRDPRDEQVAFRICAWMDEKVLVLVLQKELVCLDWVVKLRVH